MYIPSKFSVSDAAVIDELVRDYPLAHLVFKSEGEQFPSINPVVFSAVDNVVEGAVLLGHISALNPIVQAVGDAQVDASLIFTGARSYISPNWYPSKQVHHRTVPTYNYCTVVVHGSMRLITGLEQNRQIVHDLTDQLEGDGPQAWSIEDAPPEYIDQMLKGIVGLHLKVTQVEAKFKLSQNREPLDREAVQMELESAPTKTDGQIMAELMNRVRSNPKT